MSYTPSDIAHLKTLAYHPDGDNVLLAFELLKSNGWEEQLLTPLYWMQQRFLKTQETALAQEATQLLQTYAPQALQLGNLFSSVALPIQLVLQQWKLSQSIAPINYTELAKALYQLPIPRLEQQAFLPFLTRFGTISMQEQLLPLLIRKQHTGLNSLDLSNYEFVQLPPVLLQLGQLEELILDNNALTVLPEDWSAMSQLESLHLRENQLTHLPASLAQLPHLKRLYLQENHWEVAALSSLLSGLPALEYLSVGEEASEALQQLEALVQYDLLQASQQEKKLFLAFELQDKAALQQLTLVELFEGLQHEQAAIRALARTQLLTLQGGEIEKLQKQQSSIATLGLVSFAARKHLEQLEASGWAITTDIVPETTHLLLGDYPEQYEVVGERPFYFLSEQDVLGL